MLKKSEFFIEIELVRARAVFSLIFEWNRPDLNREIINRLFQTLFLHRARLDQDNFCSTQAWARKFQPVQTSSGSNSFDIEYVYLVTIIYLPAFLNL